MHTLKKIFDLETTEIKTSKLKLTLADNKIILIRSTPSSTQNSQTGTGPDAVHQNMTQNLNSQ